MSQFAKNYLPILFNLFTMNPDNLHDSRRLAMLETIKVYLTVTESKVLPTPSILHRGCHFEFLFALPSVVTLP